MNATFYLGTDFEPIDLTAPNGRTVAQLDAVIRWHADNPCRYWCMNPFDEPAKVCTFNHTYVSADWYLTTIRVTPTGRITKVTRADTPLKSARAVMREVAKREGYGVTDTGFALGFSWYPCRVIGQACFATAEEAWADLERHIHNEIQAARRLLDTAAQVMREFD